jgi:hypothetical protein
MTDSDYGIWDDGEWISWGSIHAALDRRELQEAYPLADPEVALILEDLVELAMRYHAATNRYLQIWGELGELYAEVKYGLRRHRPCTAGSDGCLGNDLVEVKTLSPEKRSDKVAVKRAGNFNKLLIVRISEDFQFEARMIDRKKLGNGISPLAHVRWSAVSNPIPE